MEWLTPDAVSKLLSAIVPLIAVIAFIWKVATKDDIKRLERNISSLKVDTERDIKTIKEETEHDMESLKADTERDTQTVKEDIKDEIKEVRQELKEIRQDIKNLLKDHSGGSSAHNEMRSERSSPEQLEDYRKSLKGESNAGKYDKST